MNITSEQVVRNQPARSFWWDRARPVDAEVFPLRAVIFDVEALSGDDGEARAGLADLVLSLFAAGVWVGVVSPGRREHVQPLVRELIGDGMAETIVSADDLTGPAGGAELYRLALWELGIAAGEALAIVGSRPGCRAAAAAGLPVVAATGEDGYDGLLVDGCRRLQGRLSCRAAS